MGARVPAIAVVVLGSLVGAPLGGCSTDKSYSATELQALQTREFDAGMDATFDAAVGTCFDLGFNIDHSDKRAGFLSASQYHGPGAWSGPTVERIQAKLDSAAPNRTSVRLNTISNGQTRVNEKLISEFFAQMESHHLSMRPGGKAP